MRRIPKMSTSDIALAWRESLGNQGEPILGELLENFSNSVISLSFPKGMVEFVLDVESLNSKTEKDLKASLDKRGIEYDNMNTPLRSKIWWRVNGIEYYVIFTDENSKLLYQFKYASERASIWYQRSMTGARFFEAVNEYGEYLSSDLNKQVRLVGLLPRW